MDLLRALTEDGGGRVDIILYGHVVVPFFNQLISLKFIGAADLIDFIVNCLHDGMIHLKLQPVVMEYFFLKDACDSPKRTLRRRIKSRKLFVVP